jgi:hypothetical protein
MICVESAGVLSPERLFDERFYTFAVVGSLASSALVFEEGKLLQYYSKQMKKYGQVSFQRFTIFRPVWVVISST